MNTNARPALAPNFLRAEGGVTRIRGRLPGLSAAGATLAVRPSCITLLALLTPATCIHLEREQWQKPEWVVKTLAIRPGSSVADLGSGDGYFTLRFAGETGPQGRVYAVDISQKRLDQIATVARSRSLANVETVLASIDDPRLTRPVALIFICNAYHHLPDRIAYLRRLERYLLPEGRIAIIELDQPPWYVFLSAHRTDPAVIREEMAAADYVLTETHDGLAYQSFQVFKRATGKDLPANAPRSSEL